jgi:hypothetical protein
MLKIFKEKTADGGVGNLLNYCRFLLMALKSQTIERSMADYQNHFGNPEEH